MGLRDKEHYHDKQIFFITTTCYNWYKLLVVGNSMTILQQSIIFCSKKFDATILGYVFMPNHIHLILHFNNGSKRIDFMRDFKRFTSSQIRKEIEKEDNELLHKIRYQYRKQKFKIWQDRFDELFLDNRTTLETKLNYIHNNPLQEHWNLCDLPENYKYSSAKFYLTDTKSFSPITHYKEFF